MMFIPQDNADSFRRVFAWGCLASFDVILKRARDSLFQEMQVSKKVCQLECLLVRTVMCRNGK